MKNITNATKAGIIAAVNSVFGVADAFGFHFSHSTLAYVLLGTNLALGAAAYLTRKLSSKWQATAVNVAAEVAGVADEVAAIKKAAPALKAVAAPKKAAAPATKPTPKA